MSIGKSGAEGARDAAQRFPEHREMLSIISSYTEEFLSPEERAEFDEDLARQKQLLGDHMDDDMILSQVRSRWKMRKHKERIERKATERFIDELDRQAGFPVVTYNGQEAEIEFDGKVYAVDRLLGQIVEAVVHHGPVGLTELIGPHPKRQINKLPSKLRDKMVSTPKGYIWQPD